MGADSRHSRASGIGIGIGVGVGLLVLAAAAAAETVVIEASRDATLIEDADGGLANGSGPVFFAGRTNQRQDSVRRGLLYFDVAAVVPDQAILESVRLVLHMTPSNARLVRARLHRVLDDWGEGASSGSGGGGAFAEPGDSTWIHTFHDDTLWVRPGGHFVARESAAAELDVAGTYIWEGTRKMLADVRSWLAAPGRNFGWILLGDESVAQSAKSFASREHPEPSLRPVLEVDYHLPGQ